ncbi:MAG: hypothetical protein HRT69_07065, partial [Flavobacteriaceae bacterium]|nr:hypothetical protein [Flavobacteriaceae bacterium]
MKQYYILLIALVTFSFSQAQDPIVNIPDANFKNALINDTVADFDGDGTYDGDVDTNNDGEIQVSEAEAVMSLKIPGSVEINSFVGIEVFVNLQSLIIQENDAYSLDISSNTSLVKLHLLDMGDLSSLDVSNNIALVELVCNSTGLIYLNTSNNVNLEIFNCDDSDLKGLDLSLNTSLTILSCKGNRLRDLNVKNGNNTSLTSFNCSDNYYLTCVGVDDIVYAENQTTLGNWSKDANIDYSEDCSLNVIINIPDSNFKNMLINDVIADFDGDGI